MMIYHARLVLFKNKTTPNQIRTTAWEMKVWASAIKTKGAITVFINSGGEGENETRLSPRGPVGPESASVGSDVLYKRRSSGTAL